MELQVKLSRFYGDRRTLALRWVDQAIICPHLWLLCPVCGDSLVHVSLRGGLSQQGAAESPKDEGWSNNVNVFLAVLWTLD